MKSKCVNYENDELIFSQDFTKALYEYTNADKYNQLIFMWKAQWVSCLN